MAGLGSFLGGVHSAVNRGLGDLFGRKKDPNSSKGGIKDAPSPDPAPRSGREDETPLSGTEKPKEQKSVWKDQLSDFLHGTESGVESSNVASTKYDQTQNYLEVSFHNGGRYGYHDVSPQEATNFYSSPSKGGWVWDNLRRRGTVYGFQKSYSYIAGQSPGYEPEYYGHDASREWHRRIGPSGRDLEWSGVTDKKVPMAYHRAFGGDIHGDPSKGDNIAIWATAGEFIVNKEATSRWHWLLELINSNAGHEKISSELHSRHFAQGGPVGPVNTGPSIGGISAGGSPVSSSPSHFAQGGTVGRENHFAQGGRVGGITEVVGRTLGGTFGASIGGTFAGQGGQIAGAIAGEHMGASAGPLGAAAMAAVTAVDMFKDRLIDLTRKAMDPSTFIGGLLGPVQSQVAAFSPASIERFNHALENLSASLGYIFQPLIDGGKKFADELNVLYTAVGPSVREFMEVIVPPLKDFGREFAVGFVGVLRDGAEALRPVFQDLSIHGQDLGVAVREVFAAFTPLVQAAADFERATGVMSLWLTGTAMVIQAVSGAFRALIDDIRFLGRFISTPSMWTQANAGQALSSANNVALLGLPGFVDALIRGPTSRPTPPLQGGMTYAAQPARHVGIEEVGMEARRSAFSQGSAIDRVAANTAASAAALADIHRFLLAAAPFLGTPIPGPVMGGP